MCLHQPLFLTQCQRESSAFYNGKFMVKKIRAKHCANFFLKQSCFSLHMLLCKKCTTVHPAYWLEWGSLGANTIWKLFAFHFILNLFLGQKCNLYILFSYIFYWWDLLYLKVLVLINYKLVYGKKTFFQWPFWEQNCIFRPKMQLLWVTCRIWSNIISIGVQ